MPKKKYGPGGALPPGVVKELDEIIKSHSKRKGGETGWDRAAKASAAKRRSVAEHMQASLAAGRATQLDLRPKKRGPGRPKGSGKAKGKHWLKQRITKVTPAQHMAYVRSFKHAEGAKHVATSSGHAASKRGRGRPKGSGPVKVRLARKANESFKHWHHRNLAERERLLRGGGHHKGPGRPKGSSKGRKGYNKARAIARTRLSIKYNVAKLDHLMGVNGTEDYAKYGKQLHKMRNPDYYKKKVTHHRKSR